MTNWQPIETAPAAQSVNDKRILIVGGHLSEPMLALPDGDWWRSRKAQGGVAPTHWMPLPEVPIHQEPPHAGE